MRGAVPCSFSSFSVIGLCGWNFVIGFYFFSFVLFFLFSFFGVSDICRLCVGPMSDTPFCSDHPPLFFVFFSFFSISFGVSDICPTFVGHLSDAPFVFLYRLVLFSGRAFSSRPGLLWVSSLSTSLFFFVVVVPVGVDFGSMSPSLRGLSFATVAVDDSPLGSASLWFVALWLVGCRFVVDAALSFAVCRSVGPSLVVRSSRRSVSSPLFLCFSCLFVASVFVSSVSPPSNSSGTIFVMSLLNVPLFPGPVHTSTVLARVSSPCTAVILPNFQASRCLTSSTIRTICPTFGSFSVFSHFCRSLRLVMYSFTHLFQNASTSDLAFWNEYFSDSLVGGAGGPMLVLAVSFTPGCRIWAGDSASRSRGSLLTGVIGLKFRIASTCAIIVASTSASTGCFSSTLLMCFLTDLISLSHTPALWCAIC